MYLSDEEIQILAKKMLSWLRVGGHLFFRESCYHQSGNKKRGENPTEYRTPMQYVELCESVQDEDALNPGRFYVLNPIFGKSVEAYITVGILKTLFYSLQKQTCKLAARTFIQSQYLKALAASLRVGFCDECERGFNPTGRR